MATARRHHYVPQCYLKAFAVARRKKGFQTTVFDARVRKVYPTSIKNVAVELDFNRIEVDGHPLDAFETGLAQFESKLGPALDRVIAAGNLKNVDDRALVLNFMCLVALRNPRFRESFRSFHERVSKQIMSLTLATPERWASQMRKAQAAGYIGDTEVTYEAMKRFVDEDRYTIQLPSTYHIKIELGAFDALLEKFFARKWVVVKAGPSSGGFVTCDHPVRLMWSQPERRTGHYSPGYGLKGTEVVFPLSPKLALVGAFELQEGELDFPDVAVAALNGAIVANSEWQVYARDAHFRFIGADAEDSRKASSLLNDRLFKRPVADDDNDDED